MQTLKGNLTQFSPKAGGDVRGQRGMAPMQVKCPATGRPMQLSLCEFNMKRKLRVCQGCQEAA